MSERIRLRERELGSAFDLLAAYDPADGFVMERDGFGIAAARAAARIVIPAGSDQARRAAAAARASLAAFGPGAAPIAVGVLPFAGTRDAVLTVPGRFVRRDEEGTTTEVVAGDGPTADRAAPRPAKAVPAEPFEEVRIHESPTPDRYRDAVSKAAELVRAGELRKVVLARTIEVDAGRELRPAQLVRRLRAVDHSCFAFAAASGSRAVLAGATPELLVSRRGSTVRSTPLAGSSPRSGDPDEDRASGRRLFESSKDREEHAAVVDAVAEILEPLCERLTFDDEPTLLSTANVWHLATRFEGTLREPVPTALELVAALHPTPAVAGSPTDRALATIRELEPFDRGCYAGPVGWIDAAGDGEWAVALRCAELQRDRATLYAGAGIVAGSDPDAELDETERKFRAFLDALRWG